MPDFGTTVSTSNASQTFKTITKKTNLQGGCRGSNVFRGSTNYVLDIYHPVCWVLGDFKSNSPELQYRCDGNFLE